MDASLLNDPSNSKAQSRLGMPLLHGQSRNASSPEIDAAKKQHATEDKQLAEWKPIVVRLRTALMAAMSPSGRMQRWRSRESPIWPSPRLGMGHPH